MNLEEYKILCKIPRFKADAPRLELLHVALGLIGESAEFSELIKKGIFYNGEIIKIDEAKRELGDVIFYLFWAMDILGFDFEEILEENIDKLKARYPDKFQRKSEDL